MSDSSSGKRSLRSEAWFNDRHDPGETASTIDRYTAWGLTRAELQSGRPIIGIAQSGSELTPCNRIHVALAARVKEGIREAGGVPIEFPLHPIQETCRRPTAALDRNLAYLGLVEILCGYPFDGVVLTTGCDKTTPACLMAAASVNIPPKGPTVSNIAGADVQEIPPPLRPLEPSEELFMPFFGVVAIRNRDFMPEEPGFNQNDRSLLKAIAQKLGAA